MKIVPVRLQEAEHLRSLGSVNSGPNGRREPRSRRTVVPGSWRRPTPARMADESRHYQRKSLRPRASLHTQKGRASAQIRDLRHVGEYENAYLREPQSDS